VPWTTVQLAFRLCTCMCVHALLTSLCSAVMSSHDDSSTVERLSTSGAADYLVKPVSKAKLTALRRLMVPKSAVPGHEHKRSGPGSDGARPRKRSTADGQQAAAAEGEDDDAESTGSEASHNTVSQTDDDGHVVVSGVRAGSDDVVSPAELLRACMAKAVQGAAGRPTPDRDTSAKRAALHCGTSLSARTSVLPSGSQAASPAKDAQAAPSAAASRVVWLQSLQRSIDAIMHMAPCCGLPIMQSVMIIASCSDSNLQYAAHSLNVL
jgi:CheY-like chemotaxis protein